MPTAWISLRSALIVLALCAATATTRTARAVALEAPLDVLAHGSGESLWIARVMAARDKPNQVQAIIHARLASGQELQPIAQINSTVVELANRGSQLIVLLEDGQWQMVWSSGSASGRALPGNAKMIAITGERDRIWAMGLISGGMGSLPTRPSTTAASTAPLVMPTTAASPENTDVESSRPTTRPATEATSTTTAATTSPATRESEPRQLVLFRLDSRGQWEACAELPVELSVESARRIAMNAANAGQPSVAILPSGNNDVLHVYRLTPDRQWKDLGRVAVPGGETIGAFDWVNGMPRPTLWIAGKAGPGRLFVKEEKSWRPQELEASNAISSGERRAITVASERIRLIYTHDGKVFEQKFELGGTALGASEALSMPQIGPDTRFLRWINIAAMVALMMAMLSSLRKRREMSAETLQRMTSAIAPMARRLVAGVIDALPVLVGAAIVFVQDNLAERAQNDELTVSDLMPFWIGVGIYLLHTCGAELVWQRSLGKRLLGLRVVSMDGSPAGPAAIVMRNLLRLAEIPISPVVLVMMFYSPLRQRAGDIAAATLVVSTTPTTPPSKPQQD